MAILWTASIQAVSKSQLHSEVKSYVNKVNFTSWNQKYHLNILDLLLHAQSFLLTPEQQNLQTQQNELRQVWHRPT